MAEDSALETYLGDLTAMADLCGLPREWRACAHCGEQNWVLPPHGLEPCPLVVQTMEQLGLKIDAERTMALRTGIGIEEMTRVARELGGDKDD